MDMGMIINEWEAANSNNVFRLPASRLNPCASAFTKKRFRLQQKGGCCYYKYTMCKGDVYTSKHTVHMSHV